jgi:hypothetical protein
MAATALTVAGDLNAPVRAGRQVSDAERELVTALMREFTQATVWRNTTAMRCEEIAELIDPNSRNTFMYGNFNWPGGKKTQQQVDATGALALHRFCAIAESLVTPRNTPWHGLEGDDYVMKDRLTRLWCEQTTADLFRLRYAASANFAAQNYSNWRSIGAYGNATIYIDKLDNRWHRGQRGVRYKAIPFGETFFGENHQGQVDRMYRWFKRTAYQAVQQWGREWLPQNLVPALEQNSLWPYSFLHVVKPRDDYDPERLDARALPFCSYYVSLEGLCLMAPEGGYRSFPYPVSRYDNAPGETYGRGPADIVLPGLKTLNAEKATYLTQGHKAANPALLINDDGLVGMDNRPGAKNFGGVTADGKPLVHILPTGDIGISEKMMAEERGIIDDVFLVSLFKVLTDHPNMTATQVIELVNEKGMLVAPTLGRQFTDYIGGMVPRELDLMAEMGMIRPMPPRLREAVAAQGLAAIGVTDTSPLAMAAKAGKAAGFMRTVESVKELVNITQDMSLLDPFNFQVAIPAISRIGGVPEEWMADPQMVAQKAQSRAKAQQRQEQIQAMPAQAAMLKAQATVAKAQPGIAPGQGFGGPQPQQAGP